MRFLQICVLLLGLNLLLPTLAIHFTDAEADDTIFALFEDISEEEEEDGENTTTLENTFICREWQQPQFDYSLREQQSFEAYSLNNNQLSNILLEVHTPPPENAIG